MSSGPPRRVLVTGGTGNLGRHVVAALEERPGIVVRIASRRDRAPDAPPCREWVRADLVKGDLAGAVRDVDAIIHLASDKGASGGDVLGTRRLLADAAAVDVRHVVVISIIGCDRIALPFYSTKMEVEGVVRASAVPWTLVRVAQFHSFVERLVSSAAALPIPAPIACDLRFQPVDEREVAERLVDIALGPALQDAPEIAGPDVLTLGEIAATWLAAKGVPAKLVPVTVAAMLGSDGPPASEPWVRSVLEAYRAAWNTPRAARTLGRVRFADWLRRQS